MNRISIGRIKSILTEIDESISETSIRFILDNEAISSVLVGFSKEHQIDEITNCSGSPKINKETMKKQTKNYPFPIFARIKISKLRV